MGVVLYPPGSKALTEMDAEVASKGGDNAAAIEAATNFFRRFFPMLLPGLREADLGRFAQKQDRNLPRFSYAGPVLHHGSTTCLVSTSHMTPYTLGHASPQTPPFKS